MTKTLLKSICVFHRIVPYRSKTSFNWIWVSDTHCVLKRFSGPGFYWVFGPAGILCNNVPCSRARPKLVSMESVLCHPRVDLRMELSWGTRTGGSCGPFPSTFSLEFAGLRSHQSVISEAMTNHGWIDPTGDSPDRSGGFSTHQRNPHRPGSGGRVGTIGRSVVRLHQGTVKSGSKTKEGIVKEAAFVVISG